MAKELSALGWDYLTFVLFIVLSIALPLWGNVFGKKVQNTKADYVFAKGAVSMLAIMLSIARGTLGIRSILGFPSELFYYGSAMWETIYGMVNAYPLVCFIFVPVYFNLGITSVYQYLDLRFKSRLVRCLASGTYIIRQVCTLGITVYTPSVALATLIGIPYWISIIGLSVICIVFTILGGLKAAINADAIQTIAVIFITLTIIIKGTVVSGGPKAVYKANMDSGRLKFFNFTGDMTVRVDTTSAWLGQLFMSLSQFGCQQNFMQRYVSLKSVKEVKRAMMSNIPLIIIFFSLAWIVGMVLYAVYAACDPFAEGYIRKRDEILPFFIEDHMNFIPGFIGIFVASLFNGALCLNVSNLNSLATVLWEDFLSLLPQFKGLTDKQQLGIIKITTVILSVIVMGMAFGVGLLTGVIETSMLAISATSGPLLGAFILAMLVPIANWKGTALGMIVSHIFVMWITFGGLMLGRNASDLLPTSTEGCSSTNFAPSIHKLQTSWLLDKIPLESSWAINSTTPNGNGVVDALCQRTPLETLYSVSYMYYSFIGTLVTVVIGCIVSYLTQSKVDEYDSNLLHPVIFRINEYLPFSKPYFVKDPALRDGPPTNTNITETLAANNNSNLTTTIPKTAPNGEQVNRAFEDDIFSKDKNLLNEKLTEKLYCSSCSSRLPHPNIRECQHCA